MATGRDVIYKVKAERANRHGWTDRATVGVTKDGEVMAVLDYERKWHRGSRETIEPTPEALAAFLAGLGWKLEGEVMPARRAPEAGPRHDYHTILRIIREAEAAGRAALVAATPEPMVVQQHASPIDDSSPVVRSWYVSEGVCGFAWVTISPATSALARYLLKSGKARKGYGGGAQVWVSEGGQSYDRKVAYASAYADVLRGYGYTAWDEGRLD